MGAATSGSPRAVLETELQLYFKTLQLQREVAEILKGWFEEGAPLGLTLDPFKQLLRPGSSSSADHEALFQLFDTDQNQKADAFEVLCAVVLLAEGGAEEKLEALFRVFDFSGDGRFSFDEVNILMHSVCRSLAKVGGMKRVTDEELVQACRQLFDAHNLPYDAPITRDQVRRWVRSDVEAARLVRAFQGALPLPQLEAELARREEAQAAVFSQLCGATLAVPAGELLRSATFRASLGDPPEAALRGLVDAMAAPDGSVAAERFSRAARAWNAFAALAAGDAAAEEAGLEAGELPLLLQLRQHEAPAEGAAERLRTAMGLAQDGRVSRAAWLAASLKEEEGQ